MKKIEDMTLEELCKYYETLPEPKPRFSELLRCRSVQHIKPIVRGELK